MNEKRCRYCQKSFQPSKFQRGQQVCSAPECQRQRRADYHRQKIATDSEYRQVCRDSPRKWRARNPVYWKQYRKSHPTAAERNRQQQKVRDRKRRLRHLANNTSARDIKHSVAEVWLLGAEAARLANNNSASAQVWVIEALPPRPAAIGASCKQQPSGSTAAPAA
jgi:hypothetical protein